MTALASCPFCGSNDVGKEDGDGRYLPKYRFVSCNVCYASGPKKAKEDGNGANLWNKRVLLPLQFVALDDMK